MRKRSSNKGRATTKAAGFIRIIAGTHRGRKLPVHDIEGLRPTTDRVKETVFNWLMNRIRGSVCLDCFAGSGALGFEALSRGAESVTMIELDNTAANQLQNNLELLKADKGKVIKGDCLQRLQQDFDSNAFDLVFIDPPFRQGLAEKTIEQIHSRQLLSTGAMIYVEVESELSQLAVPEHWQLLKEKTAGQVRYCLYQS